MITDTAIFFILLATLFPFTSAVHTTPRRFLILRFGIFLLWLLFSFHTAWRLWTVDWLIKKAIMHDAAHTLQKAAELAPWDARTQK